MRKLNYFSEVDFSKISGYTIFLDIDGTIVPDGETDISKESVQKIKLIAQNNHVYFCSNGSPELAKSFSLIIGCDYFECRKPITTPFKKVLNTAKFKDVLVVGDKYSTDGLLAKFLGARFLRVERLLNTKESKFIKFTYLVDNIVYKIFPMIELIRPWQWPKNFLVFAPLFFALKAFDFQSLYNVFLAFLAFCFASSTCYVLNDLKDVGQDRLHLSKMNRPIAAGFIGKKTALKISVLTFIITAIFAYSVPSIFPIILLYFILNLAYSFGLKHIAVVDIVIVSIFYILRVVTGGLAATVPISPWIITCVFFGSLFVIVGKRKSEHVQEKRRIVLDQYSEKALDLMLGISASLAVVSYLMWSITGHVHYLTYSTVFVVFSLFRILNTIYTHPNKTESPELLVFKDISILTSFVMWLLYVFVIFYLI